MFWFHATRRPAAADYVSILRDGCRPSSIPTHTNQLELELSVGVPHVYCYLGRTREQFGDFAVALSPADLPEGHMCPFDSGGLVENTPPVSSWARDAKASYLDAFSFSTATRASLVGDYPGTKLKEYLAGIRPIQTGPHEVWAHRPEANIWEIGNHWRSWTWEGRWPHLPIRGHLRAWSCAPALFVSILEQLEAGDSIELSDCLALYREGGVGAMISEMSLEQANV